MFQISPKQLDLETLHRIWQENELLELSDESKKRIQECRDYLDKKIEQSKDSIYGINTGFGSLCKVSVSKENLEQLQVNLVVSHACGTGDLVDIDIVRLMLLLKIHA